MEYTVTNAIEEAKKELIEERGLSPETVDAVYKKIIYNFLKI